MKKYLLIWLSILGIWANQMTISAPTVQTGGSTFSHGSTRPYKRMISMAGVVAHQNVSEEEEDLPHFNPSGNGVGAVCTFHLSVFPPSFAVVRKGISPLTFLHTTLPLFLLYQAIKIPTC